MRSILVCLFSCFMFTLNAQCDEVEVELTVTPGDWAWEIDFELLDDQGNVVYEFDGFPDDDAVVVNLCLPEGCYVFTLSDDWGDGWNGATASLAYLGLVQEFDLPEGAVGYFAWDLNTDDCNLDLPGCTDPEAVNYIFGATADDGSCQYPLTMDWNGEERTYFLYTPTDLEEGAPLVFVFHGYWGSALGIQDYCGMNAVADAGGFAVCYPQGLEDEFENNHWNSGLYGDAGVDDLGFVKNLAWLLQEEHGFAPSCTYACGMSNGGYMAYHLACHASDVFAAVGSVTGAMSAQDQAYCNSGQAVPIIHIHGTDDDDVLYNEGINDGTWGAGWGVPEVLSYWQDINGCVTITETAMPDLDSSDGSTVDFIRYHDGPDDVEIHHYRVNGGGHSWFGVWDNFDIDSSVLLWDFFSDVCQVDTDIHDPLSISPLCWTAQGQKGSIKLATTCTVSIRLLTTGGQEVGGTHLGAGVTTSITLEPGIYLVLAREDSGALSSQKVYVN